MIDTPPKPALETIAFYESEPALPSLATELIFDFEAIPDDAQIHRLNVNRGLGMCYGVVSLINTPHESKADTPAPYIPKPQRINPWEPGRSTLPSSIQTTQIISHWVKQDGGQRIEVATVANKTIDAHNRSQLLQKYHTASQTIIGACVDAVSLNHLDPSWYQAQQRFTPKDYEAALYNSQAVAACNSAESPFAVYQIGLVKMNSDRPHRVVRALHPGLIDSRFALEATQYALLSKSIQRQAYLVTPESKLVNSPYVYRGGRWS
jgi:hypothetical protein